MIIQTWEEFIKEGKRLFGTDNPFLWWFVCPICGHKQQGREMLGKYPDKKQYIIDSFFYSCEGRINGKGVSALTKYPTSKTGCDYTNGGLFSLHKKEVIRDGETHKIF